MPDKIRPLFFVYLPNEILAIIANELASDMEDNESLAALASCRLAAHALCSLATPLLFSSIRLTDLTSDYRNTPDCSLLLERATRLNQAITNRHIAASVHTLTLNCHQRSLQDPGNAGLISSILHGLPHIRNFALESVLGWMDLFFIPNDLVLAIQALCRSPSLTTLYLDHINNFSSTAITACPNLRCLRLRDIIRLQFDNIDLRDDTSSPQLLCLDSLEIDANSIRSLNPRLAHMIGKYSVRIKNLQIENLFYHGDTLFYAWDIMRLASQTLTTLDLPMGKYEVYPDEPENMLHIIPFDLSRLPALRHLKVQWRTDNDSLTHIDFLTQWFSTSSSFTGVETLEIGFIWQNMSTGDGKDLFSSDTKWSALDQLLSSEMFDSLSKVVLRLRLEIQIDSSWERDLSELDQHILESERHLTLPYINDLFPIFRALTDPQRTLETHFDAVKFV